MLKNKGSVRNLCVSLGGEYAPIGARSNCNQTVVNPGIIEQMLLNRHSTLFLVKFCLGFPAPEPYVNVSGLLVENVSTGV